MRTSNTTNIVFMTLIIFVSFLSLIATEKFLLKPIKKARIENIEDKDLQSILKDDYVDFVKELGHNITDPKFRAAIRSLSSINKVYTKNLNLTVTELLPTQNEIDVDKSLKYPLTKAESARKYLNCKKPIKILDFPIVTSTEGKYLIDGHHRWAQVYSINPKCNMTSIDLTDITNPINALKSTLLGIAAGKDQKGNEITKIPISKVEGKNLLKIPKKNLIEYVKKTLNADVLKVFNEYNQEIKNDSDVAEYIWKNVNLMQIYNLPIKGAPGRDIMPQTDISVNWVENTVNVDDVLDLNDN